MRTAARRQVTQDLGNRRDAPAVDMIIDPRDGHRPYLLSAVPQEALVRRLRWPVFFVLGAGIVWAIGSRLGP